MRFSRQGAATSGWLASGAVTVIILAVTLITSVIIARLLGPDGRGALTAATVWPAIIAAAASFSLNEATIVLMAGPSGRRDTGTIGQLISTSLLLHLIAALLAAVGCVIFVPLALGEARANIAAAATAYGVIFSLLTMVSMHQRAIIQGVHRTGALNLLRLVQPVAWLVLVCILGLKHWLTWEHVAYAALAALGCACIIGSFLTRPTVPHFSARGASELLRRASRFHATNVALFAAAEADKILAVLMMGDRDVGIYVTALSIAGLVSGMVIQTLGVRLISDVAAAEPSEKGERVRRYVQAAILASTVLGLGAIVAAPIVIPLFYGTEFQSAVLLTQILALGFILKAVRSALDQCLRAMNYFVPGIASEVIAFVFLVVTALTLNGPLGLLGLCAAFVLAQLAALACVTALGVRRIEMSSIRLWGLEDSYYWDFIRALFVWRR